MKFIAIAAVCLFQTAAIFAQQLAWQDTIAQIEIFGNSHQQNQTTNFYSQLLENNLANYPSIQLVNRSGYAPEISYRGLNAFQTLVKVDGIRIIGACTDRMDPAMSYVETSNLKAIQTQNDLTEGNAMHGIQLSLQKPDVNQKKLVSGKLTSGFHFNGLRRFNAASVNVNHKKVAFLINANHRKSNNYSDGLGNEINYTQFEKTNIYAKVQYAINHHLLEASIIYDNATDIGFAALPMDVSLAQAKIGKLKYSFNKQKWQVQQQIYVTQVYHEMDDSKRPDVAIRMDMPGWSNTLGLSGEVNYLFKKVKLGFNYEGFSNFREAEMTMFPPNEIEMFMYTWAPMQRKQINFSPNASFYFNDFTLYYTFTGTLNSDAFKTDVGTLQLNVFDLNAQAEYFKYAINQQLRLKYHWNKAMHTEFVSDYGERLPEISELYGFYLFNSQDGFDYVGNPNMQNEVFFKNELIWHIQNQKLHLQVNVFNYFMNNYVFGLADNTLSAMTIGANGVKFYNNFGKANIRGSEINMNYQISKKISTKFNASYLRGVGEEIGNLPWISPLQLKSQINYTLGKSSIMLLHTYAAPQNYFNAQFGENATPEYHLFDAIINTTFKAFNKTHGFNLGCQNILNRQYHTHLDWNDIVRPGRNFFVEVNLSF